MSDHRYKTGHRLAGQVKCNNVTEPAEYEYINRRMRIAYVYDKWWGYVGILEFRTLHKKYKWFGPVVSKWIPARTERVNNERGDSFFDPMERIKNGSVRTVLTNRIGTRHRFRRNMPALRKVLQESK